MSDPPGSEVLGDRAVHLRIGVKTLAFEMGLELTGETPGSRFDIGSLGRGRRRVGFAQIGSQDVLDGRETTTAQQMPDQHDLDRRSGVIIRTRQTAAAARVMGQIRDQEGIGSRRR